MNLETERLLLRPFESTDLDTYAEIIFADDDVTRFLPKSQLTPRERAERTIKVFNDGWNNFPYSPFAVVEKSSGNLIGHCGLRFIPDIQETEVLYAFGKNAWGKGYATEAAQANVDFGFNTVGLDRIIAVAVPANTASRKVMEHCGLKYEKDTHLFNLDLAYYALNKFDYQNK